MEKKMSKMYTIDILSHNDHMLELMHILVVCIWSVINDTHCVWYVQTLDSSDHQIKFYLKSAMYIWKKRKISKKLFTRLIINTKIKLSDMLKKMSVLWYIGYSYEWWW